MEQWISTGIDNEVIDPILLRNGQDPLNSLCCRLDGEELLAHIIEVLQINTHDPVAEQFLNPLFEFVAVAILEVYRQGKPFGFRDWRNYAHSSKVLLHCQVIVSGSGSRCNCKACR